MDRRSFLLEAFATNEPKQAGSEDSLQSEHVQLVSEIHPLIRLSFLFFFLGCLLLSRGKITLQFRKPCTCDMMGLPKMLLTFKQL